MFYSPTVTMEDVVMLSHSVTNYGVKVDINLMTSAIHTLISWALQMGTVTSTGLIRLLRNAVLSKCYSFMIVDLHNL